MVTVVRKGRNMQIVVNGLVSGTAIALLALAFHAVYLPTRVFFIGMAGIYTISPFVAYSALKAGVGWCIAGPTAIVTAVFLCLVCEQAIHSPLERRMATGSAHLIASMGSSIVIVQITAMIWGNDPRSLRVGLDTVSHWGGVIVTGAQWITAGSAVLAMGAFGLFLVRSDLGLRLRALSDNPIQFVLLGYDVGHHRLLSFGIAGCLAAIASLTTAYDVGFDAHAGLHAVLLAVVAVIIGGQRSFIGPIVGGVILGVVRTQVAWHWSARWQEAVTFALLALVLLLLPQGLLGGKARLENTQ